VTTMAEGPTRGLPDEPSMMGGESMGSHGERKRTRRAFLARMTSCIAVCGGMRQSLAAIARGDVRAISAPRLHGGGDTMPVVSFLLDEPYVDPTGLAPPYVAPRGTRSGQPLAELAERTFRAAHPWA
jgi:hypothetical protein